MLPSNITTHEVVAALYMYKLYYIVQRLFQSVGVVSKVHVCIRAEVTLHENVLLTKQWCIHSSTKT